MHLTSGPEPGWKLYLLGGCEFQRANEILHLETQKTSALLAYLALQTDPQSRHKLIGLFWGDQPEPNARRNLRHALWNLRQHFNCPSRPPLILADQQTIAFDHHADHWLDVREFEGQLSAAATTLDHPFHHLRHALDLYRGDLLDGVYVDDAPGFEEWLLIERERLRGRALEALHRLVSYSISWGEYDTGLGYARRLLELEPWMEEAHRQMMRLLALSGQRSAALTQYETCRRILAEELNVEPTQETQSLFESVRASSQEIHSGRSAKSTHNLPPQATPFIGREEELAELGALLRNPSCRLLTLVGPGGMGKTRLAIQAAQNVEPNDSGIFFIPLASIGSDDLLVSAIADAIGLVFRGDLNTQTQLLDHLRGKNMLMVLDNFEHLLSATGLLEEILRVAPGVKMLATSRERLNLLDEWLFDVKGLQYPTDDKFAVEDYSAVQLFLQSAQRVRLGYSLSEEDKPFIVQFCRLVEGMPLAIELAANWVRMLSCQEIVLQVERGLDLLATAQRDLPARHRNMRAVFEHSWQLFSDDERSVFKRLSIFQDGFRQEAAENVAGAHLFLLASLVDKSFIRRNPSGRYEIHELLRQYGEEKLSSEEYGYVRDLHCDYFANFLYTRENHLKGGAHKDTFNEITEEIQNVRAGWDWATQHTKTNELARMTMSLFRFFDSCFHLQEGSEVFGRTVKALRMATPAEENRILLARLLTCQGRLCSSRGNNNLSKELIGESLQIARQLGARKDEAFALNNLGILAMLAGEYVEARQYLEASFEIKRELGDQADALRTAVNLGMLDSLTGNYEQASRLLQRVGAEAKLLDIPEQNANANYLLGVISEALGDIEEARRYYETSRDTFQVLGDIALAAQSLAGLASIALAQKSLREASQLASQGLTYAESIADSYSAILNLNLLGRIACELNDFDQARRYHIQAIQTAWQAQQPPPALDGLIGMAMLFAEAKEIGIAYELLTLVIQHPATVARDRERAVGLRFQLEQILPPDAIGVSIHNGQSLQFEDVVVKLLTQQPESKE